MQTYPSGPYSKIWSNEPAASKADCGLEISKIIKLLQIWRTNPDEEFQNSRPSEKKAAKSQLLRSLSDINQVAN